MNKDMDPLVATQLLALLAPPLLAVGCWIVAVVVAAGMALCRGTGAARVAAQATGISMFSLAGAVIFIFVADLSGGEAVQLIAELVGAVAGGVAGWAMTRAMIDRRGPSALVLGAVAYLPPALLLALVFLMLGELGDCFDNVACQQAKAAVPAQTIIFLAAEAAPFALWFGLILLARRHRTAAPSF
jgi:hypothetical protein